MISIDDDLKPGLYYITVDVLARVVGKPVTLVGHSMGGTVAIACTVKAPESVERLILAEPSLWTQGTDI